MENSVELEINTPNFSETQDVINAGPYEEIVLEKTKWYCCTYPDCSKTFRYKSEIARHNITHSDQRPHYCPREGCGKAFKRMDTLEIHLRLHEGTKPFACNFPGCNYRSINRSTLQYHYLKHENKKPYKCKIPGCNKSFLTKAHLKQHEKASYYHMRISYSQDKDRKTNKMKTTDPQNTDSTQIIAVNKIEQKTPTKPSEEPRFTVPGEEEAKIDYHSILEKLREENETLKKALKIHSELQNHMIRINEPKPRQEEIFLGQPMERDTFFDDNFGFYIS